MSRLVLALAIIMTTCTTSFAEWQLYHQDSSIIASYNYDSFAPFRGNPSAWVRWHYVSPRDGMGGMKVQFTADCAAGKLYEIASTPYDTEGNYLASNQHFDAPKEYPVTSGSLNKATYKLLCR